MGVRALGAAALVLLASSAPAAGNPPGHREAAVQFLQSRESPTGGFAEVGGVTDPALTAWAILGLRAAGASPRPATRDYLRAHEAELKSATELELGVLAESVVGDGSAQLVSRLRGLQRRDGSIGAAVNSTIWGVIALRQAGASVPRLAIRYVLSHQSRSGGWSWFPGGAPDSNDTAAAVQALHAVGVRGSPIRRALRYLRSLQNRDGGFALLHSRASDTQSTAWAIQAFLAAGANPGRAANAYLDRMRRPDGSFRYSTRYATTPVWVTAQVLPALARKPFPLRVGRTPAFIRLSHASSLAAAPPPPGSPVPRDPSRLAVALTRATTALRAAIDSWRSTGNPSVETPPSAVTLNALYQERIYLVLAARPAVARATIARLPDWLQAEARDTALAKRELRRITPALPRRPIRTGPALPAGILLRYYRQAEGRFGVRWQVLAAVNFVESAFNRLRNASAAGAQGPMQFMPATWRKYGLGGNIHDPRDAILGAANFLRAHGAPRNYRRALFAYNPSPLYVDAVLGYVHRIESDRHAFFAYYSWQVFVRTPAGERRVTGPGR